MAGIGTGDLEREEVTPAEHPPGPRQRRDDQLYEQYARHLEAERKDEFVAISVDGRLILGTVHTQVFKQAIHQFGAGNFALRRIGADYEFRWRRHVR